MADAGRVADQHHFNADPDSTFHFISSPNPDPDPALNQIDSNLRQLVHRTSWALF